MKFRSLRADEVYVRAQSVKSNGCILLLYKDSRCDMHILDETVGPLDWQRSHGRDNANCIVSIWDKEKGQWIGKEDTGVESYTEKEKGLAADSFKRACFNWGIGRELYTAPFIWVNLSPDEVTVKTVQGKPVYALHYKTKFSVSEMEVTDGHITKLQIVDGGGNVRYSLDPKVKAKKPAAPKTITAQQAADLEELIKEVDADYEVFLDYYKASDLSGLPASKYAAAVKALEKKRG